MLLQAGVHHADLLRHLGWTGGFAMSSSTYFGHFGVTSQPAASRSLDRGLCLGEPTFASIAMPSFYRPSGNGCADRVPILGITFLWIATTNKLGAINPSIFCLFGSFFRRNYYSGLSVICTQVYQMVAALTTVAWWFGQFLYIVRRTPHPELEPTCEFRLCHAFTASRRRPAST